MANNEINEQVRLSYDDDDENVSVISEADSSESRNDDTSLLTGLDGIIKIEAEDAEEHELVKQMFLPGMGTVVSDAEIVAVHKILNSGSTTREARWQAFQIYSEAVAKLRGGNDNVRFAWYGASIDKICEIVSHGFRLNGVVGGICMYHDECPMYGAVGAAPDRNGLRHMILCRVILGNMEVVQAGLDKFHPTSSEFDSGVDNLEAPKRYIVWSAFMNSHIFPLYVVSFRAPSFEGYRISSNAGQQLTLVRGVDPSPNSPWMSIVDLLSILSKVLDPRKMTLLNRSHNDYQSDNITRAQLVQRMRLIAGDELLSALIKASHK